MQTPLLAAVLIVKDEETNLPGCLASLDTLKPLLGEVIVYDTGSSDATVSVARDHGATVVEGYWDADFARARNDATSHAQAKWVLSIDADERAVGNPARLRALLQKGLSENLVGWDMINVVILDVDEHDKPLAQHPFTKLFRPSRAHWVSPIHETVAVRDARRPAVAATAPEGIIHLRHHGYADAQRRKEKAARNAGVAHAGLAADDDTRTPDERAKLLADEARSLRVAGRPTEAQACFDAALAVPGISVDRAMVVMQDAVSLVTDLGHFDDAEAMVDSVQEMGAAAEAVDWLRASVYIAAGRAREALPLLRGLKSVRLSSTLELDGSIAVATLMEAAIDAGEFDEALACAIQLVGSTGDVAKYGPRLMRLWGRQSPALLAELLDGVVGPRRPTVADGLRQLPAPGPLVAEALEAKVARRLKTRSGSAFGV